MAASTFPRSSLLPISPSKNLIFSRICIGDEPLKIDLSSKCFIRSTVTPKIFDKDSVTGCKERFLSWLPSLGLPRWLTRRTLALLSNAF